MKSNLFNSYRKPGMMIPVLFAGAVSVMFFVYAYLVFLAQDGQLLFLSSFSQRAQMTLCPTQSATTTKATCPKVHQSCPDQQSHHQTSSSQHNHPQPSMHPPAHHDQKKIQLYPKIFHPVEALADPPESTNTTSTDWEKVLLTPNGGFLMVSSSDATSDEPKGYGVSMFHQLHCLTMIRKMLLHQPMSAGMEAQGEAWLKDPKHWTHCLEYLVQAILCAADDTLEEPKPTKNFMGDVVDGIDGMGHTHQCRNATRLWEKVIESDQNPVSEEELGGLTVF